MNTTFRLRPRRSPAILAALVALAALACTCNLVGSGLTPIPTPTPAPPPAASPGATLSELKNLVEASPAAGAPYAAAFEGQAVSAGGGVRTGAESRVRLDTGDASLIRLDAGTTLALTTLPGGPQGAATRLNLEIGQIWALVSETPGAGSFEIATPESVVTAQRGSLVNVSYYPDSGRVVVTCLDGACRLAGSGGAAVDLAGGQQAEIPGAGQPPSAGSPMDGLQLSGWASEFPEAQPIVTQITPAAPAALPPANVTAGRAGTPEAVRLLFDAQGVLHLVWRSNRDRESGDFFHQQLPPGGAWAEPETLTAGFEYLELGPQLLRGADGRACVLWTGGPSLADSGTWGVYQTCQADAGWTEPTRLTPDTGEAQAALAPDGAFKVLSYGRLGGVTYNGVLLSAEESAVAPRFAIDAAGTYHALWVNLGSPYAVVHRASSDGGANWSPEEVVSNDASLPSGLELAVTADAAGNLHVVWPGSGAYYRRWSPAGWDEVAGLGGGGGQIQIAADPAGQARLVFSGGGQVYYQAQGADGAFAPAQTFGGLGALTPALAVDVQSVSHLVWVESGDLWYANLAP